MSRASLGEPSRDSGLFLRWFLVVYLPLGLWALEVVLLPFRILPGWAVWTGVLLSGYAVVAVKLLIERRRAGLGVPLPKKMVLGAAAFSGLLVLGIILVVLGIGKLTSSQGLFLTAVGGFLMVLSVTVPTFRLVDVVLRTGSRFLGKAMSPPRPSGQESSRAGETSGPAPAPGPPGARPSRTAQNPGARALRSAPRRSIRRRRAPAPGPGEKITAARARSRNIRSPRRPR